MFVHDSQVFDKVTKYTLFTTTFAWPLVIKGETLPQVTFDTPFVVSIASVIVACMSFAT